MIPRKSAKKRPKIGQSGQKSTRKIGQKSAKKLS